MERSIRECTDCPGSPEVEIMNRHVHFKVDWICHTRADKLRGLRDLDLMPQLVQLFLSVRVDTWMWLDQWMQFDIEGGRSE